MRKIISILVAVGLVLSMAVMATPAAAQYGEDLKDWTEVTVVVTNTTCAGQIGTYNITFNIVADLHSGTHSITVKFPAGTGYPATWQTGHITVNGTAVFKQEITRVGDEVTFLVPEDIVGPGPVEVIFQRALDKVLKKNTGIINPPAGKYNLYVKTSRAPQSTYVKSGWDSTAKAYKTYTINPAVSTYKFVLDFSPTYPGMAPGFIPPFKACGQNDTDQDTDTGFDTWYDADNEWWVTNFTATLAANKPYGCKGCDDMEGWLTLKSAPTKGVAHWYQGAVIAHNFSMDTAAKREFKLYAGDLGANETIAYNMSLHFSVPGTYEFCFDLYPSEEEACCPGCEDYTVCWDFEVYQWKDAYPIELDEKWNLISLPLVPFNSDIEYMLGSLYEYDPADTAKKYPLLASVWHYDRCLDDWFVYGNGQTSLTDIEDGKAYWFRMRYPLPVTGGSLDTLTWWVFGTEKPTPESGPAQYDVCEGWNMAGFVSMNATMQLDQYLWNWDAPPAPFPVAYGWEQGAWTVQGWELIAKTALLEPGQGYWIAFPKDGAIFVP